jgi:hypothetical protein
MFLITYSKTLHEFYESDWFDGITDFTEFTGAPDLPYPPTPCPDGSEEYLNTVRSPCILVRRDQTYIVIFQHLNGWRCISVAPNKTTARETLWPETMAAYLTPVTLERLKIINAMNNISSYQ